MDINWWMVSTGVLWVLGGISVTAYTTRGPRDVDLAVAIIILLWPLTTVYGVALGLWERAFLPRLYVARDYLCRKRG